MRNGGIAATRFSNAGSSITPHLRYWAAPVLALALVVAGSKAGAEAPVLPDDATFQLVTMAPDGPVYRAVVLGTAFFVASDGTALTNTHVVYLARQNPARYQLLAIVGKEFYSAVLVCAAALRYDPDKSPAVLSRDVAVVRLGASQFPFTELEYEDGGPRYIAHRAPLPPFTALVLGGDPSLGLGVRIIGYGGLTAHFGSARGSRWTATGVVNQVRTAADGTHVFRIVSTNRPGPGNSGAPVVDNAGLVVGMWTWAEKDNRAYGMAIGSGSLARPCATAGAEP